jgi:hypothetical protein
VQHALRSHTPEDDAALNATARTFPKTTLFDVRQVLTNLGIGEALVTVLDPRGVPTPSLPVRLIPPASRMAPLTPDELAADIRQSDLVATYGKPIDRESAREMLAERMARTAPAAQPAGTASAPRGAATARSVAAIAGGALVSALSSSIGRTVGREVVRGLFGLLGASPGRGTSRSRW